MVRQGPSMTLLPVLSCIPLRSQMKDSSNRQTARLEPQGRKKADELVGINVEYLEVSSHKHICRRASWAQLAGQFSPTTPCTYLTHVLFSACPPVSMSSVTGQTVRQLGLNMLKLQMIILLYIIMVIRYLKICFLNYLWVECIINIKLFII